MKEKILKNSIEVFKEKGIQKTTMRDVAAKIGVSDGHVRYYFKKKDDLLVALFNQLDEEIMAQNRSFDTFDELQLEFTNSLINVYNAMLKYDFFFMESPITIKKFPQLFESYSKLYVKRKLFFHEKMDELIALNIIRKDITALEIDILFNQFFMITDNWVRFNNVLSTVWKEEKDIKYFVDITLRLFVPYFNLQV